MFNNYNNVTEFFNSKEFKDIYHYDGELGSIYTKEKTKFILWAPTAKKVRIGFYSKNPYDIKSSAKTIKDMYRNDKGVWVLEVDGDLNGEFYNYIVDVDGNENILVDPYAKAVGINGDRGMVIDLSITNPKNWHMDKRVKLKSPTDSIIYEVHVRDFTIDENSGVSKDLAGKYKGFISSETKIPGTKFTTALDHVKEMGFTHVHLLPVFDFGSIDEENLNRPQYNWGYDPKNYNVPEGSYSTNPYEGAVRIREFKEMIQSIHNRGIGVIMDVVYNHTYNLNSNLNLAVPKYYYRQNYIGNYSNGSGCGNETASDRSMFRKFMVDSVVYWANEYHIDGFRFDLMGLHDIDTMKEVRLELDKIDKSILIYGEGWTGGEASLKEELSSIKKNIKKYDKKQIAAFNDDARDAVKGHVFYEEKAGFVNGGINLEESIKFAVVAATAHPQVDAKKSIYSTEFWAKEPYQTITYASSHDNYTLWDKLQKVCKDASKKDLIRMNKLAAAIILTSQGISFIHAGEEMARTKIDEDGNFVENSYCSSDFVNKINWKMKNEFKDLLEYYRGLILLRKSYKSFRMDTNDQIKNNISFMEKGKEFNEDNIVAYTINSKILGDPCETIVVIFNGNDKSVSIKLPDKRWDVIVDENKAGINKIVSIKDNIIKIPAKCSYILKK